MLVSGDTETCDWNGGLFVWVLEYKPHHRLQPSAELHGIHDFFNNGFCLFCL